VSDEARDTYANILLSRRRGEEGLTLTYSVPPALRGKDLLGAYVLVPLATGLATGYVVGLSHEPPEGEFEVKGIVDVLERSARLSEDLVRLGELTALRTCAALPECLQAMVPAGAQEDVKTAWQAAHPASTGQAGLFGDEELPPEPNPVLDVLRGASEPLTVAEIKGVLGREVRERDLEALAGRGLARKRHVVVPARTSKKTLLALAPVGTPVPEESVPARAHTQRALLEKLVTREEPIPLVDLARNRAVANALVQKGLARIVRISVLRRPTAAELKPAAVDLRHTDAQRAAIGAIAGAIDRRAGESFVLHGVTGSGKTEVYLAAIEHVLRAGGTAITLVPEISLTPQTVGRFRARFGDQVAVLHSALGSGERLDEWTRARDGEARIVIGARSAVFAPVSDLKLIVIDEEQEHSYKQNSAPRYHARDVALDRARLSGAALVLGSATPSLESYQAALDGRHRLLSLPDRVGGGQLPEVQVVDMREETWTRRTTLVSEGLSEALQETIAAGHQAILLLNRRGWSPFLLCKSCGEVIRCDDCDVSLTYHQRDRALRCHHCGFERGTPERCPTCGSQHVHTVGAGTERAEQEVRELVSGARVIRMDRDTTREKGAHGRILSAFERGAADILIGTQMIAKGLDFPRVTLVGVLLADTGLHFPDFRAGEFTFSLLAQVAGRAGRGPAGGSVIVQTFCPDHWAVEHAAEHDYAGFFEREIDVRRRSSYPPFSRMANVLASDEESFVAERASESFGAAAERSRPEGGRLLGPTPAAIHRLRGQYRFHCELFAPHDSLSEWAREALSETPEEHRRLLTVDIDPLSLL